MGSAELVAFEGPQDAPHDRADGSSVEEARPAGGRRLRYTALRRVLVAVEAPDGLARGCEAHRAAAATRSRPGHGDGD